MNQNIGIQSIKDVLLAYLDMHGTMLIMNVLAAIYQDKSLEIIVHVLHQKQFGIMQVKLVSVQQMLTETIVFHALFQDNGIFKTTPVFVPPYNLMERSKLYMSSRKIQGQIVSNVLYQDIGIQQTINVYAIRHLLGMERTVFALSHTSCSKKDAHFAHKAQNGKKRKKMQKMRVYIHTVVNLNS